LKKIGTSILSGEPRLRPIRSTDFNGEGCWTDRGRAQVRVVGRARDLSYAYVLTGVKQKPDESISLAETRFQARKGLGGSHWSLVILVVTPEESH